jgi:Domain of unknown function (DUF4157)
VERPRAYGAPSATNGRPVPDHARAAIEPTLGHSFADVLVYDDSAAHSSADALGASAFTVGQDVYFARGLYEPESPRGIHLLAHELAHTVQQRDTAPGAQLEMAGPGSEEEAHHAADAAVAGVPASIAKRGGAGTIAREPAAAKETEAQRAQRLAGQFGWLGQFLPNWAVSAGGNGITATQSDGMTTTKRTADASLKGGFSAEVGQHRITEADKDHAMESSQKLGFGDAAGYFEWMTGGRWLADDGTKQADKTTQKLMLGPGTIGGRSETSTTDDTVTKSRATQASIKDGKWSVEHERGRQFKLDADHQMGSKTGVSLSSDGGGINRSTNFRSRDVDTGAIESESTKKGLKYSSKDGFSGSYGKDKVTEIDGQKFGTGTNVAVSTKGLDVNRTKSHTQTDDAGNETTTASGHGVKLAFDGSGAYTHSSTDAAGNKTSASIGGKLDPNALELNAGISRNGKSVTVKGGYETTASEPRKVGDHWVVDWERKLSAGGGGSAKGVGAQVGYTNSEFGTRAFKSEAEAAQFKENAAYRLPSSSHDPTTVDGAMFLEIGEMRGAGSSSSAGVSVSASPTAGSISAGASTTGSSATQVRRVSANEFELTYNEGSSDTLSGGASTLGVGASAHSTDTTGKSKTVRVDVTTSAGRAAFEKFTKGEGAVTAGAKLVSESDMTGHDQGQTVAGPGFSHLRSHHTSETVTKDESGKTESYRGGTVDAFEQHIPWSKSHSIMQMELEATEHNDTDSTYMMRGLVDATSGHESFKHLADLTGTATRDATQAKSSGKWGVELELTDDIVNQFEQSIGQEKVRAMGIFDGTDARNDMRKALQAAKTSDDKKRALTHFFAEAGEEGEGIEAMRNELYGAPERFHDVGYDLMKRKPGQNFFYDLTLKDDRNFQGLAARKELESKMAGFDTLIQQNPAAAGTLHGEIYKTLNEVKRQRSEIADPKRYTDLPDELRENQLARLDQYVSQLSGQAQQAGIAFTTQDEAAVDAETAPAKGAKGGKHGKKEAPESGPDAGLKHVRKEMGLTDREVRDAKKSYDEAYASYMSLQKLALRGHGDLAPTLAHGLMDAGKVYAEAHKLKESAAALDPSVNALRSQYVEAMSTPETALGIGSAALGQLTMSKQQWWAAAEKLWQAEGDLRNAVEE